MKYISPFELFDLRSGRLPSPAQVEAWKARVPAHLPEHELIFWKPGYRLTKGQLLWLCQDAGQAERLALHQRILEDVALHRFLDFGHTGWFNQSPLPHYEANFWEFIAPFFETQFLETWKDADKKNNEDIKARLLSAQGVLPLQLMPGIAALFEVQGQAEEDEEPELLDPVWPALSPSEMAAYTRVEEISDSDPVKPIIKQLRLMKGSEKLSYISERELRNHLSDNLIRQFNKLSDQYQVSRNYLAQEVMFFAEMLIHEYGRQDGAEALLRQALKLKLGDNQKRELIHMLRHYGLGRRMPPWLWLALGITLLMFLLRYLENKLF